MASSHLLEKRRELLAETEERYMYFLQNARLELDDTNIKNMEEMENHKKKVFKNVMLGIFAIFFVCSMIANAEGVSPVITIAFLGIGFVVYIGGMLLLPILYSKKAKSLNNSSVEASEMLYNKAFQMQSFIDGAEAEYLRYEKEYKDFIRDTYKETGNWVKTELIQWMTTNFDNWYKKSYRATDNIFNKNVWGFVVKGGHVESLDGDIFEFGANGMKGLRNLARQSGVAFYLARNMEKIIQAKLPMQHVTFQYNDNYISFSL